MNAAEYGEGDFEYESEGMEAEDNEAGDESLGAEGDEGDEGDESTFEGDEGDEGDEAESVQMSASARLRADRDRGRRAAWARKIAADQRVEAQRAASAQ